MRSRNTVGGNLLKILFGSEFLLDSKSSVKQFPPKQQSIWSIDCSWCDILIYEDLVKYLQVFESVVQDLCLNEFTPTNTQIGYNNIISTANKIESVFIIDRDNKTATLDIMRIKDNDTVSIASKIELASLEMLIINIQDNSIAARISNGADITLITKENNDLMLVTDK